MLSSLPLIINDFRRNDEFTRCGICRLMLVSAQARLELSKKNLIKSQIIAEKRESCFYFVKSLPDKGSENKQQSLAKQPLLLSYDSTYGCNLQILFAFIPYSSCFVNLIEPSHQRAMHHVRARASDIRTSYNRCQHDRRSQRMERIVPETTMACECEKKCKRISRQKK